MTIESLKEMIEKNIDLDSMYIFLNSENTFLANQYVNEISKKKNLKIVYIEDLKALLPDKNDIFGVEETIDSTCLYICHQETFDFKDIGLKDLKNLIIICDKIDDETKEIFDPYIVNMPKLEEWMIKDYVYTIADGVDTIKLDWLIKVANNDIYRIDSEISKIAIFPKVERNYIFDLLMEEDAFADLIATVKAIKEHADEWNIDANLIGGIGFSAGGHLIARGTTSGYLNFGLFIYPAYLNKEDEVAPELKTLPFEKLPPIFIAHSEDDASFIPGSKIFNQDALKYNPKSQFHCYKTGGHGYGLKSTGEAIAWPEAAEKWLKTIL